MLMRLASQIVVALLWLLHWLPLPVLATMGRSLGKLLFFLSQRRRNIALTNLALCLPELDPAARNRLAREHFAALGCSILDRAVLWWGGRERILRMVRVVGDEKIVALRDQGRPVILLAMHFVGLDAGALAMAMRYKLVTIYAPQSNPVFEQVFYKGRRRFGEQIVLTRKDGVRPTVRAMRSGHPFYYFPDMDFGARDSIFVPYFGHQAATITGLSRLARAAGAAVLPCVTRMLTGGQGYIVEIGDAWEDFPTHDVMDDTVRMNVFIENVVRSMPEQYFWVHRRFKTRPSGAPRFY